MTAFFLGTMGVISLVVVECRAGPDELPASRSSWLAACIEGESGGMERLMLFPDG
jgi:hypothetical protein